MERTPQPQEEFESSFDREAIAAEAAETARVMLAERVDASLETEERFATIIDLMNELAEDNGNRFIVEAMSQRLSYEREKHKLFILTQMYPYAAANDEDYDYKVAA